MNDSHGVPTPFPLIDAVFILGKGALIYVRKGEAFAFVPNEDYGFVEGWTFIETDVTLVQMLIWLNIVMPKVYRYQSIAPKYLVGRPLMAQHLTDEILGIKPI